MNLEEVKAFLAENQDNAEVATYLKELKTPTLDGVKGFLEGSEEGKVFFQAEKDRYFTKGLDTWKKNNLDTLVASKVSELYPEETEEAKRIKILEQKLQQAEEEKVRNELLNKALSVASEKKLPTKFIDRFLGKDEEETLQNLATFEETWNESITGAVEGKFKENGYDPGQGNNNKPNVVKSLTEEIASVQIRQT